MESLVHLRAGRLTDTLAALQADVRRKPDDAMLRVALFQTLCALGQWPRAHGQLDVLRSLSAQSRMLATVFGSVLECEIFRTGVFAGLRTPLIFGEPPPWITGLVQALKLEGAGEFAAATALREAALAAAPAQSGRLNGDTPFAWLADADTALGPVLEAIFEGKYYWVPFARIAEITISAPEDLRDLVWIAAHFTWQGGGETDGFIPVRYAGTETHGGDAARLARATAWRELPDGSSRGVGQRLLATDQGDYGLLELKSINLDPVPTGEGN